MKVFIIFAVAFFAVVSARSGKPEYHWRDFNGTIPRDALEVASKGSEGTVYVGQGYFEGIGLLPGMIKSGVMELQVVADGKVYKTNENIQIMATHSKHPETDFQWIPITYDHLENMKSLKFLRIPPGGTESKSVVYIGRHSEEGYTNIGKVYTLSPYQGLTILNKNQKITIYKNFEILALLNFDCTEEEHRDSSEEF